MINPTDITDLEQISNKETILDFSIENSVELQSLGLTKKTILFFEKQLGTSKERTIPIFKYTDINGELTAYTVFSKTYKNHVRITNNPSYFCIENDLPPTFVKTIIICPDPIELMSYYQLSNTSMEQTIMLCPHIQTKLSQLKELTSKYPNATFKSLYPDRNPTDILNNIALCLALFSEHYSIVLKDNIVTVKIGSTSYSIAYDKLNRDFYYSIRHRRFLKIKTINPPLNNHSFNSVINVR